MYCKVEGCRFADLHATCAHVCGTCGAQGHGVRECGNSVLLSALAQWYPVLLPFSLQCCVANCKDVGRHASAGHQCTHCKLYAHDATECPGALWDIQMQRGATLGKNESDFKERKTIKIQARNKMGWEEHKIYTALYAGMGCWWYARRTNLANKIELMYMHSDEWGQYGSTEDATSPLSVFQKFIEGFRPIDVPEL